MSLTGTAGRRGRAARTAGAARQVEGQAQLVAVHSHRRLADATAAIDAIRERTRVLLAAGVDPALRAHLLQAGSRHLALLDREREQLAARAAEDQEAWSRARLRVRSLDKLLERLDATLRTEHQRADNAEWQDLLTTRRPTRRPRMSRAEQGRAQPPTVLSQPKSSGTEPRPTASAALSATSNRWLPPRAAARRLQPAEKQRNRTETDRFRCPVELPLGESSQPTTAEVSP